MCTSSIQKANGNSIEFSLSTQTRRVVESSQTKSLHLKDNTTRISRLERTSRNMEEGQEY